MGAPIRGGRGGCVANRRPTQKGPDRGAILGEDPEHTSLPRGEETLNRPQVHGNGADQSHGYRTQAAPTPRGGRLSPEPRHRDPFHFSPLALRRRNRASVTERRASLSSVWRQDRPPPSRIPLPKAKKPGPRPESNNAARAEREGGVSAASGSGDKHLP